MANKDIVLTIPGNQFAALGRGKYSPLPQVTRVPSYCGYLVGRSYWANLADVTKDLSGNGRHGTLGVAIGAGTLTGIAGIRVLTGGSGYTTASVSLPGGATAAVQLFGGAVVDIAITAVGTGLSPGTYPLTISGDGSGATAQYTVGDGIGEMSMCSPSQWIDAPFTSQQLLSRTGKASLLIVSRQAPGQQQWPIGDRISGSNAFIALAINSTSGAFSASTRDGATERSSNSADTHATRLGFQFALSTHSLTEQRIYYSKQGGGLVTGSAQVGTGLANIASTRLQRMGKDYSGATGINSAALAVWWDDYLTVSEVASVYSQVVNYGTNQDLYVAR